jgi:hypothetical protein
MQLALSKQPNHFCKCLSTVVLTSQVCHYWTDKAPGCILGDAHNRDIRRRCARRKCPKQAPQGSSQLMTLAFDPETGKLASLKADES